MTTDVDANIKFPSNGYYANPSDDHSAITDKWREVTAGSAITLMSLCQLSSDGKWDDTDADSEAASNGLLGVALTAAVADADVFIVVLEGLIRDDAWNFTVGADLFVSGTAGEITETAPSGSGDVVRRVGHAVTADIVWFDPDNHYEVV